MKFVKHIQRKKNIHGLIAATLILAGGISLYSNTASSSKLRDIIESYVADYNLSGLAVVVTRDNEVIYEGSHGKKQPTSPFATTDRSYIASVSKPMTATAVLMLAEEGAIDIDAPITAYLKDFTLSDGRQEEIIIRNLMNHTSGLSSKTYRYEKDPTHSSSDFYREFQKASLASEPGTEFSYSNEGYKLLGVLIEVVSGQSYGDFMAKRLFRPLGMTETAVFGKGNVSVDGYTSILGLTVSRKETGSVADAPSGFILSSARDVSKFLQFHLTGVDVMGNVLLSRETLDQMHKGISDVEEYALGWMTYNYKGIEGYRHPGDINNFAAQALFIPESGTTVTLLANKNHFVYSAGVYNMIVDAIVASLHEVEYSPPGWVKWIILLYPLIILGDIASSIFDTLKIRRKYLKTEAVEKGQLLKTLFSSAGVMVFVLAGIPMIISYFMNRGVTYAMLWGITPDLLILMFVSAAFKLLHMLMVGYKLYLIRGK